MGRSPVGSSFDDFIEDVWQEACEEGPEAVAETACAEQRARLATPLLALRLARRLSQSVVAQASGIQQADISRFERGLGNPTLKTLSALGKVLGFELAIVPPRTTDPVEVSEPASKARPAEPRRAKTDPHEMPVGGRLTRNDSSPGETRSGRP
ncbi:MAG: helix-turn-helix domain-containing protein [Chloroflexota bacterium]